MQIGNQIFPFSGTTLIDALVSTVTGTASPLTTASTECVGVEITALSTNTDNILIGNSVSQNRVLVPSESVYVCIDDLNKVYAKSSSGTQSLTYLAVL